MPRLMIASLAVLLFMSVAPSGTLKNLPPAAAKQIVIAVFIPGALQGSPSYVLLDDGVRKAAAENPSVSVKTIEGGFNQAQWGEQIATLASKGEYDFIVTTNPAMPEICAQVAKSFPKQKFIILEAWSENPAIASLYYNHRELGFLHGYLAGLIANEKKTPPQIGLIVGQEYPEMNNGIRPGVEEGIKAVSPQGKVEFRVVGNWYDASKGEELAKSLFSQGTSVVLPIAGSANQGVLTAAKQAGKSVLWYDDQAYQLEPGVIVGCGKIYQDRAAYELVKAAIAGTLVYGKPRVVGVREGYLDYLTKVPEWVTALSPTVRKQFEAVVSDFRTGKRHLDMPLPKK